MMKAKRQRIDESQLDSWSSGQFTGEHVEFFRCAGCRNIYLGLPDSHVCFIDPKDPARRLAYSIPRTTRCPSCGSVWHDGKTEWKTESVTQEEIAASEWGWLCDGKPK
jgi:uncharacterized protein with PIN domain